MLKITSEEIHFILYQYLHESGFEHSSFVFAQEANMHENRFNEYRIPSGMLFVFLEKALTLMHMETHLDDNEEIKDCRQPFTLLTPHTCDISVEQTSRLVQDRELNDIMVSNGGKHRNQTTVEGGEQVKTHQFNRMPSQQYEGRYQQPIPQQLLNDQYQQQMYQAHLLSQVYQQNTALDLMGFQKFPQQQFMKQQIFHPQKHNTQSRIKAEPLQHNPDKGQFILQADGDNLEISSALFNPKQRMLVAGGNYYSATMWDLSREPNQKFGEHKGALLHVKRHFDTNAELQVDVSSVHWSWDGLRLVTSSNDMMARIWRFDEETGQIDIESVKTFNMMLMNSKFNKPHADSKSAFQQLVATGGHSSVVTIWNAGSDLVGKDVAKLVHTQLDPNLVGIEIDWQNSKTVAVTGYSVSIFLWNIQQPQGPIQVWTGGHTAEVEQIKWDPTNRLLASCSTDNRVCLWKTEQSSPAHVFEDLRESINQIQWSNISLQQILLIAGDAGGTIAVWNVVARQLQFKFQAHQGEPGGVKCLALSPNNSLLATGGADMLCVWSVDARQSAVMLVKQFQKPLSLPSKGEVSGSGATGTATALLQSKMDLQVESEFSQISWSHDGLLLAAAIQNRISVLDVKKFS